MLKGGSLLYATVIALIIAILSGSLMLFSYFKEQEKNIYLTQETLFRNVLSGVHLALASDSIITVGVDHYIDLWGNNTDSVFIRKINWGGYQVILSKTFSKTISRQKAVLIGSLPDTTCKAALYLQDNGKPLTLCGKTFINGTCYLPQAGVKWGNIEGKFFDGKELINGRTKLSSPVLPAIDSKMIDKLQSYFFEKKPLNDSMMYYVPTDAHDSILNSFFNKTIRIYSHNRITLSNGSYYSGNILIVSDTEVVLTANCIVNNIIIYAPIVRVQSTFSGSLQIYARDSICVPQKACFIYPSVLGIIRSKVSTTNAAILLGNGVSFSGNIFGYNNMASTNEHVSINIGKTDTVRGQVFTNGEVTLDGIIYGNVICSHFIATYSSGQYEDYLLDATIDAEKRSQYYLNTLFVKSTAKSILKWVY